MSNILTFVGLSINIDQSANLMRETFVLRKLNNELKFQSNVARSKAAKAFLSAALAGDVTKIQNYIKAHKHDKNQSALHVYDKSGNNALMFAANNGHESIVKLLLDAGLNMDMQNQSGLTALHWASAAGHLSIVKLLVHHGANFTLKTNAKFDSISNFTAEDLAAMKKGENYKDIADFLWESHVLKVACGKNKGDLETIERYLKNNPNIMNIADEKENNILDIAAMSGNLPIVQAIVKESKDIPTLCIREAIAKAKLVKSNETVILFLQSNLQHRIISYKTKSHFNYGRNLQENESKGSFSHKTRKTTKAIPTEFFGIPATDLPQKYKNCWYLKKAKNANIAQIEVVAQEFFRLLIPGHPKTRLVISYNYKYFVASKEIEGARDLPNEKHGYTDKERTDWNNALRNGTIVGIGEVAAVARLLHEDDLKNGNQKINFLNRIIKFDGDKCFFHLQGNIPFTPITSATIAWLPLPDERISLNWLGCICIGEHVKNPLLDADLSSHPRIRAEVNHAILKIMLLPDELIEKFVALYVMDSACAKLISDDVMSKRNQMRFAALENQDFINYVKSSQAEKQCKDYIAYLQTFKTTGKNFIFDIVYEPEKQMLSQFDAVRSAACTGNKKLRI